MAASCDRNVESLQHSVLFRGVFITKKKINIVNDDHVLSQCALQCNNLTEMRVETEDPGQ